jgi:hypothetical protein
MKLLLWLSILTTPLIGLIAGTWLTPKPVVLWNSSTDYSVHHVLGFVDQGSILLRLVAMQVDTNPATMRSMVVEGLDTSTGVCRFQLPVPEDVSSSWTREGAPQLTEDGSAILFLVHQQIVPPDNRIALYDWRKQQIIRRFRADSYRAIINATYRNGTLIARAFGLGDKPGKGFLLSWHGDAVEPSVMPLSAFQASISKDGTRVVVNSTTDWHLQILDVKNNIILQKIPGMFGDIHWGSGNQQFLAISINPNRSTVYVSQYTLQNGRYEPDQNPVVLLQSPGEVRFTPHFLLLRSETMYESWRRDLISNVGETLYSLVNYWCPEGTIRQLHDVKTGQLLHRIVLPRSFSRTGMSAHPTSHSIAVFDEAQVMHVAYPSGETYYSLVGLALGLALSALFFRYWLIIRRQEFLSIPMVYLRRQVAKPIEAGCVSSIDN